MHATQSTFEIGNRIVTLEQVFAAAEPMPVEMAAFCNTLGQLVENGVPILEAIVVTANGCEHPWFVAILAEVSSGLREGETIVDCIVGCLKKLTAARVGQLSKIDIVSDQWNPADRHQWSVPDFFGFFADFIAMVDAGEHTGALDTALVRLRDMNLNGGEIDGFESLWGRDVSMFREVFEFLNSNGIPDRTCLEIMKKTLPLSREIDSVISELDNESTLMEALSKTGGQLSHPSLVAIFAGR